MEALRPLTKPETIPQRLKPFLDCRTYGTDKSVDFQARGFVINLGLFHRGPVSSGAHCSSKLLKDRRKKRVVTPGGGEGSFLRLGDWAATGRHIDAARNDTLVEHEAGVAEILHCFYCAITPVNCLQNRGRILASK